MVGLAGCQEPADVEEDFESGSAVLGEEGVRRLGFSDGSQDEYTFTNRRTIDDEIAEATITNRLARYVPDGSGEDRSLERADKLSVGVVATPNAQMLGEELNPYIYRSPEELLQSDRGKELVGRLGGPSDFEWTTGVEKYGERSQVELLGESVPLETFAGVVEGRDGHEIVVVYLARATNGDGAVIASAYKGVPVSEDFEGPVVRDGPDFPGYDPAGKYVPPADVDPNYVTQRDLEAGRAPDEEPREESLQELGALARGEDYGYFQNEIEGTQYNLLIDAIPDIELGPPLEDILVCPTPSVNPTSLRLVQTFDDSGIEDGFNLSNIPPVHGDYTSALFSLEVDGEDPDCLPEKLVGKVGRMAEGGWGAHFAINSFTFDKEDQLAYLDPSLDPDKEADHRKVWSEYARENDSWFPVWVFHEDTTEVEVTIETPVGSELGKASMERGLDWPTEPEQFGVLSVQPLKVGFIRVRDRDDIDRYGWESSGIEALAYRDMVETAVDYIRANFPGGVVAYRADNLLLLGGSDMPDDHSDARDGLRSILTGNHGVEQYEDHDWWDLGAILYSHHFSDWVEAGQEIADANGVDVVVMVVPSTDPNNDDAHPECDDGSSSRPYGGYYHYHRGTECPGDHGAGTGGLAYRDAERRAVSVLSSAGDEWYHRSKLRAAETTAHEIAHYFDIHKYGVLPGNDYPFAMRVDDGDESLNGQDVDFQHAHRDIEQYGFDLRGGTFRTVHRPDTDGTDLVQSAHDFRSVERYPSFMTYTGDRSWVDSLIYASLARSQYDWRCHHDDDLFCITDVTNLGGASVNFAAGGPPGDENFDAGRDHEHEDSDYVPDFSPDGDREQEHEHDLERRSRELLTATVTLDGRGRPTVQKYRVVEGVPSSPPPGDDVEVTLLAGPEGERIASETHPHAVGTFGGQEPEGLFVDVEFPLEGKATHLRVELDGKLLVGNVFEGVLSSTIDQLAPEATTREVESELSRQVERIGAFVDERNYEAAWEALTELEGFVEREVQQIDPIIEEFEGRAIADVSTRTRNNLLEQVGRLQEHLEEML